MPWTPSPRRPATLAALVALSAITGPIVFAGSASGAASGLSIEQDQPIAGEGTVSVRVAVSPGDNVSFKLEDASGTISRTRTVTDGGSNDSAALDGVVETTLNLSRLFETPPESGTGIIYAGQGDGFSIPQQDYTSKVQVAIDAADPTAAVTSDGAAKAGTSVTIGYTATDVPQKVRSVTLRVMNDSGTVFKDVTGLQTGTDAGAQFTVPSYMQQGAYDVQVVVVDEVGHRETATMEDALTVTEGSGPETGPATDVGAMELVSSQPVNGSGNFSVTVATEETVTFKVMDAAGHVSSAETVTDGSSEDLAETQDTVVTELNLGRLYEKSPASGTTIVYAGNGTSFSIPDQTFEDKRQFALDADAPTATVTSGDTGEPGDGVKIGYDAVDVPAKVASATLHAVAQDGTHYLAIEGLQGGSGNTAQFTVPKTLPAGRYDLTLAIVDEVGHRETDTMQDGLVVEAASGPTKPVGSLTLVSPPPVAGTGNATVAVQAAPGSNASFTVEGPEGSVSATKTVTDGGPTDLEPERGLIRTHLNLSARFDQPPESGTGIIYANSGDSLSIPEQRFDDKLQTTIDADTPTAAVTSGASAEPGQKVRIGYTATDVPQKLDVVAIRLVDDDGLIYYEADRLQSGTGKRAEFKVPSYMPAGSYDIRLITVDEVGHRETATLEDGFTVESTGGNTDESDSVTVSSLDVVSADPIRGTGEVVVEADVSEVGGNVSFRVQDANGNLSAFVTVTDGGSHDQQANRAAVVRTTLNLSDIYDERPDSGTAIVYAGDGQSFSIDHETYDIKRQFVVDADAPDAAITDGGTAAPGTQVKVDYRATDVPQKVDSITLEVVGSDGTVHKRVTGLQAGTGRTAQFVVPHDLAPGAYDLRLVVVDEVGHRTTPTLPDGLTVTERSG